MENFSTKQVKNIALLGHAGSGKTTLAECMLYEAGLLSRRGTVEEHNTVSDYQPIEQERGSSIFATPLHTEWKGYKINILDTPGNDDFVGEVIASLKVADTGVMLLNAAFGVEVGTDILWEYTEAFKTPMIFAVNQADHDKADFERTVEQAKNHFSKKVTVVQYPLETG
ncbi:MAG: GTP-binding protein, partial [Sphingobacteriales bacterium]